MVGTVVIAQRTPLTTHVLSADAYVVRASIGCVHRIPIPVTLEPVARALVVEQMALKQRYLSLQTSPSCVARWAG